MPDQITLAPVEGPGQDVRVGLFAILVGRLNPAAAALLGLGLAASWGGTHWVAILSVAVVEFVVIAVLSVRTRRWDPFLATRVISGWAVVCLAVILVLDGGYPSPFWVIGLLGAIAFGVMMDRRGLYAFTAVVALAMVAPRIVTGIDVPAAAGVTMAALGLLVIGLVFERASGRLMADHEHLREADQSLRQSNARLTDSIGQLEHRNREVASITAMGRLLHSTATLEELRLVLGTYLNELFPDDAGAVYLYSASRNDLAAAVSWGGIGSEGGDRAFAPDECWALRQGQTYHQDAARSALHCGHVRDLSSGSYFCVPLLARGEMLGVLHLRCSAAAASSETSPRTTEQTGSLVDSVTEYVALALANQALRETLRNQAIRDPLTGLYNRRFAEESLEREILRATRNSGSLSLIYLDVDHFKSFNDTYGHEAGDVVLQQLGVCVREHVRGEDVACRYGGEEFLLILADTPVETARQRAEALREQFKARTIKFGSQYLGPVTLSLGVARFPDDGTTPPALIGAADAALYQAKAAGRDRVVTAGDA